MTDTQQEVFLVWDLARVQKGDYPELLALFGTVDDAIDYAKREFDEDSWDFAQIENWLVGQDHPQAAYTLAENQAQAGN